MQATILKSRILWIRLLLLRPLLLAEAKHTTREQKVLPDSSTLRDSFGHATNALCVTTAHAVLQELYEKLGSVRQNSAWHVLLFTFAGASTLVVATLCPDLDVNFETEPSKTSWDRALKQKFRESVMAVSRRPRADGTGTHYESRQDQADVLLPFSSVPGLSQTPVAQDFGEFLNSDLLKESWFKNQGIDLSNWSAFQ